MFQVLKFRCGRQDIPSSLLFLLKKKGIGGVGLGRLEELQIYGNSVREGMIG